MHYFFQQEEKRKKEEEKQRKKEEERKRKEEEKRRKEEEKKRKEEEKRMKEEEERQRKEEEKKKKEEEKRLKEEQEREKKESEKAKKEEEKRLKEEQKKLEEEKKTEENLKREQELKQKEENVEKEEKEVNRELKNKNMNGVGEHIPTDADEVVSSGLGNNTSKHLRSDVPIACSTKGDKENEMVSKLENKSPELALKSVMEGGKIPSRPKTPKSSQTPRALRVTTPRAVNKAPAEDRKEPEKQVNADCLPEPLEVLRLRFMRDCQPWRYGIIHCLIVN